MDKKSIGLKILFCAEEIIAIRVLLFSIPVMINKYLAGNFLLSDLKDCFIAVLTVVAFLYLIVGIVSIFGYRHWKVVHYVAAVFTLIITGGSLRIMDQPAVSAGLYYFSPILFSVVIAAFAGVLGRTKQAA